MGSKLAIWFLNISVYIFLSNIINIAMIIILFIINELIINIYYILIKTLLIIYVMQTIGENRKPD